MSKINVLFLGQKPLGEACFRLLRSATTEKFSVKAVVTNATDDVWWRQNDIWQESRRSGITAISNDRRATEQILSACKQHDINVILSVQHPWILPQEILDFGRLGAVNFHNAPLPEYQGHNCCNHAILNGDVEYRTTAHRLELSADDGDIIFEDRMLVTADETALSLYIKSNLRAVSLFKKTLSYFKEGRVFPLKKQNGTKRFFRRDSIDSIRELRTLDDAGYVSRVARALFFPPFEPAFCDFNGQKIWLIPSKTTDSPNWRNVFNVDDTFQEESQ